MPSDTASAASGSGSGSGSGCGNDSSHTRLPVFWTTRPELWFIQVEAAFAERTPPVTTDAAKFRQVLRVLPNEVLEKVEFVLTGDEQVGGRYAALKGALIDCYGRSNARRNAELIALAKDGTLGDRKPTEFLMHMRSLHQNSIETWEKATLLNALPPHVRAILSNSNAANNKRLAQEANAIMEENDLADVNIRSMSRQQDYAPAVEAVSARRYQDDRQESRRRPEHQEERYSRNDRGPKPKRCYTHNKFGSRAFTCKGGDCDMRDVPLARPPPQAPGNARAGR